MSDPCIGSIRIFAFNWAPKGWAYCNGKLLPISQNTALFSLLGTTYGGDGKSTFALPDLAGCIPIHAGRGIELSSEYKPGQSGGHQTISLIPGEMPAHSHVPQAALASANTEYPTGAIWTHVTPMAMGAYTTNAPAQQMSQSACTWAGSSLPHENMMPGLGLGFFICLSGVYPARG